MPGGSMRTVPLAQEEIVAAQRRYAGLLKNPVGEILVGCKRCRGRTILRVPGTPSGAEINAVGLRRNAEDQSRSAVDVLKSEPEFGTGICRVDRLVRIESGLSRSKFPHLFHALSGGLAFPFFDILSLTKF